MTVLDRVDKVARLLEVVATPGGIRAMSRWRPFSVASFRLVHGLVAEGLSFATVIDVGANVGKFSRAALGMWPDAEIIAFEALPAAAARLRAAPQLANRVKVHEVALGATDGTLTFYPHEYSLSSSPLPIPIEIQQQYSWARESQPIEVPERRLDSVVADGDLKGPMLLKLDVQGYELEVMKGAKNTLPRVAALLIEQSFDKFYQGQPVFNESHQALVALGWRLARLLDWRREDGRVAEVDCLYVPADSSP